MKERQYLIQHIKCLLEQHLTKNKYLEKNLTVIKGNMWEKYFSIGSIKKEI